MKSPEEIATEWASENTGIILLSDDVMTRSAMSRKAWLAGYEWAKVRFSGAWDDGFEAGKKFAERMEDEGQ